MDCHTYLPWYKPVETIILLILRLDVLDKLCFLQCDTRALNRGIAELYTLGSEGFL